MTTETPAEKYADYDAAFAEIEEQRKPLIRRLFGRDWELPAVPPAAVFLRVARFAEDDRELEDLTAGEVMLFAGDMIPDHVLTRWLDLGLTVDQLAHIILDLFGAYRHHLMPDGDDPEAVAPETGQTVEEPTSYSATGVFSKPTLPASTAATSTTG